MIQQGAFGTVVLFSRPKRLFQNVLGVLCYGCEWASWWLSGKDSACSAGDVGDLGWEGPLEEGVATHSSIFTWRIPWTEEPGGLQYIGLQKVGHD